MNKKISFESNIFHVWRFKCGFYILSHCFPQAYGVPLSNAKYYEGAVSYCTAKQMNDLLTQFRKILDTDGGGWTRPVFVKRSSRVQKYKVKALDRGICVNLITSSQPKGERYSCWNIILEVRTKIVQSGRLNTTWALYHNVRNRLDGSPAKKWQCGEKKSLGRAVSSSLPSIPGIYIKVLLTQQYNITEGSLSAAFHPTF